MEGNFVADTRLEDSDEVLQLPIVKNRVKKLLQGAVKKLPALGVPVIPSSDDNLEDFLQAAGRFFGRDPAKWDQVGEIKVDISEENGKRTTRSTGMFAGTELHLTSVRPHFDARLPEREDRPEFTYNIKNFPIQSDQDWQDLISDQPWTPSKRRQMLTQYLHAKIEADDVLKAEGAHGFWELAIQKENHADITRERLEALLANIGSTNLQVATVTAAAVWGLATTGGSRRTLADLDAVVLVVDNIKRTLKMATVPDPPPGVWLKEGEISQTARTEYQSFLLGSLALMLVDRNCRRPYLQQEQEFSTLFALCQNLEGYADAAAAHRRETAAKILASLVQRDPDARASLVTSGALRSVLGLLKPTGPGQVMIQFCMASLLATMVLDDEAMDLIKERRESHLMFECCIVLLKSTLTQLQSQVEAQRRGDPPVEGELSTMLGVRLAEATAQAMWGSAHVCVLMQPIEVSMAQVEMLGAMGLECFETQELPLGRVCYCITATMATLSSHADAAELIMTAPSDKPLQMLLTLLGAVETDMFEMAGHVKAAACAGVAFLACHPIGAVGDECMYGPYRRTLLDHGAFGALLRAALTSVMDVECDQVIQQAAAIGVMFLSSMAGAVEPSELAMYTALLSDSDNSEMIEFLMAGMWILLRDPGNRKVLGTSFGANPASAAGKTMMSKMSDAVLLHDVNDFTQEQGARVREALGQAGAPPGDKDGAQQPETIPEASEAEEKAAAGEGPLSSAPTPDPGRTSVPPPPNKEGSSSVEPPVEKEASVAGAAAGEGGEAAAAGGEPLASAGEQLAGGGGSAAAAAGGVSSPVSENTLGSQGAAAAADPDPRNGGGAGGAAVPGEADQRPASGSGEADVEMTAILSGQPRARHAVLPAEEVEEKLEAFEKKFDSQLKENWGLETLVAVGESWLPGLLEQDEQGSATDIPVLKLFEFLVASICLFMVEDAPPGRGGDELYTLSAPTGVRSKTWWTVDAHAPDPHSNVDSNNERALAILLQVMSMRLSMAWKSIQLSVLTLWNSCARNPHMERHVVERGACIRLLDIVRNNLWPPSLRDLAGGCLAFFSERYSNLYYFALDPEGHSLQDLTDWPLQQLPSDGLVPFISGLVVLMDSRFPLLELRGCQGLGRLCYAAPSGCPSPKDVLKESKATAASLDAIDALIALLKRHNKRYADWTSKKAAAPTTARRRGPGPGVSESGDPTEDDINAYARDMSTPDAMQDVYQALLTALLNISVFRPNQPIICRKGLLAILGCNSLFYGRVASEVNGGKYMEREQVLLNLSGSIIQNIALHPDNRTRLYRAELRGTQALDRMLEAPTEEDRSSPSFLPLLSSPKMPSARDLHRTNNPHKLPARAVQHGSLLNTSVDTALASVLRPKVMFPSIIDKTEDRTGSRASGARSPSSAAPSTGRVLDSRLGTSSANRATSPATSEKLPSSPGGVPGAEDIDSRGRFLNWLDNTFADQDAAMVPFQKATADSGKKTHRKQLWDDKGQWLDNEPESAKALNKLLCRPLNHLWQDTPEGRGRHGKARWEPIVSEYQEPKSTAPLTVAASRLLQTLPPRDETALMDAASQVMATGHVDNSGENGGDDGVMNVTRDAGRPPTRERQNGRVGLTVLQPHPAALTASRERLGALGELPDEPVMMPLKVALGPKRARQVITFEDRIIVDGDTTRPSLTMFEHVEGAKVSEGLYPSYQLPNGKQAFMYYNGGALLDEVHVDAVIPPPRPSTVPQALQQAMPLADVLNLIAKPPGSAPPFIPYKPVPRLVPLPSRHTLTVKHPDQLGARAFGDLREDNLQLIIQAKKIIKTQTMTRVEAIEVKAIEEREAWTLLASIFKPRVKECDAHQFVDTATTEEKMFERDWQRAVAKEKFASMMFRENKANKKAQKDDATCLAEVQAIIKANYQKIYAAFVYYAVNGTGDPYHMALNSYTSFLDDCSIADSESQYIKRSDCDTIFIVCNFQPDKKSAEAQVNQENAMMRYEFLESIVRAAIAKYGKEQSTTDVTEAVQLMIEKNILCNLPPGALINCNDFRHERLYFEEVDMLLKRHQNVLKALYSRYRLKPTGGGLRPKSLKLDGWQQLMQDASLVDGHFTLMDGSLAFMWARMYVIDEIRDYGRYTVLSFVDFLEALSRVADMKSLPTASDLSFSGYGSILDWALEKERNESSGGEAGNAGNADAYDIFRQRESAGFNTPKARPLYVKLDLLLELIFQRLFYDPLSPDTPYSTDGLLKVIKKIDKDLGP